jgi:hypothetical protein
MEAGAAILLGLLGGLHCAGMCGPLMLALPAAGGSRGRFIAGRLVYQLGRVATYGLLGVVFGLVGKTLFLAGVQRWVSLTLGLLLLAGLVASPRLLEVRWLTGGLGRLRSLMARYLRERTLGSLAVLGFLNGLLPCGLVYVAGAGATAAGSVWGGVGFMTLFGLGTLPVMLGMSLSGRVVPALLRHRLQRLVPASVAVLALLLILRGLALGIPYLSPDLAARAACCHPTPAAPPPPAPAAESH